jgi:hypothetical protein
VIDAATGSKAARGGGPRGCPRGTAVALLCLTLCLALLLAFAPIASGASSSGPGVLGDDEDRDRGQTGKTIPPEQLAHLSPADRASRRALEEGLSWLADRQRSTADGALPPIGAQSTRWAPVGVTALGSLAFLAAGSPPARGPYGSEVAEMVNFLSNLADMRSNSETHGAIERQGDSVSRAHGHGYATLVLAQAYGMSPKSERLERVLKAAVARIEGSQGAEGGWGYQMAVEAFHEGSITIAHVQALRAARNVGIAIDDEVVARAEDYVRRLQKEDGTFRYKLDDDRSSIALTAAAISTLNATGTYDDPAIQSGIDAIFRGLDRNQADQKEEDFPLYMRLYLAQALWQLSDPAPFERWWEKELKTIVRTQRADGSWGGSEYGDCYATAINCLALAIPEGVLPIFQR